MSQTEVEQHSNKRLMQTSPVHRNTIEALDSANALRQTEGCEFAYVTGDDRVVSFWDFNDVTPDQPLGRGQKRVLIPNYPN